MQRYVRTEFIHLEEVALVKSFLAPEPIVSPSFNHVRLVVHLHVSVPRQTQNHKLANFGAVSTFLCINFAKK